MLDPYSSFNLDNGEIQQLLALRDADDYVCSVKFTREGNCVAVGTPQGSVELWDVGAMKKVKNSLLYPAVQGSLLSQKIVRDVDPRGLPFRTFAKISDF